MLNSLSMCFRQLQGLSSGLEGSLAALVVAKQSAQSQVHASAVQVGQACQSLHVAAEGQHDSDLAVADGILKTMSEAGQKLTGEACIGFGVCAISGRMANGTGNHTFTRTLAI